MSAIGSAASSRLTPKTKAHPLHLASPGNTRQVREESGLGLSFRSVIGTTTTSVNAFDADQETDSFVCCAGPAVILYQVNEHCEISQQLFRARENVLAVTSSSSFYNSSTPPSTPNKGRHGSPLKDRGFGRGSSVSYETAPSPSAHARANTRNREATCVSLSPGGRLLAVGETGYSPRVLLFSTSPDVSTDVPLSVLTDHSFGVTSVGFSGDSRWLCTLGNSYDGFILVYSINDRSGLAKLHSSNKCSNVNAIFWMGQSIVSIGTRHAKVWRLDRAIQNSPSKIKPDTGDDSAAIPDISSPKTLPGRNCLLGALIDATFTAAVALSDFQAVLCTAQGDVCLLDDTNQAQRLKTVAKCEFPIECVTVDHEHGLVWFAGQSGTLRSISLDDLLESNISLSISANSPPNCTTLLANTDKRSDVLAIGIIRNRIISIGADRYIQIRTATETASKGSHLAPVSKSLPAHDSAVLGVRSLLPKARPEGPDFMTFSKKGSVMFWMLDGTCTNRIEIPLDQSLGADDGAANELRSVMPLLPDDSLVSGDRNGVVRYSGSAESPCLEVQAHSGDVNSIVAADVESSIIVASCGRDRIIQIFQKRDSCFKLIQTLEEHAASVTDLMFLDEASSLLSISSDRTVMIRRLARGEGAIAYLPARVITLKASPTSFTPVLHEPHVIMVSTTDRQIQKYDISSGQLLHSFKAASDSVGCEAVIMGSLAVQSIGKAGDQTRALVGVSSTDKSIRIYDYDSGTVLARESAQKAVSATKLLQYQGKDGHWCNTLVSCGLDSTIMIYDVSMRKHSGQASQDYSEPTMASSTRLTQPLRRILSKAEIASFQRSLEDDEATPLRSTSPSRGARKPSRVLLGDVHKGSAVTPATISTPRSPALGRLDRNFSPMKITSSPSNTGQSKAKRPSSNGRRRSKGAVNPSDINDGAEQICKSLRAFRKQITSTAVDKIDAQTVRELESELALTLRTLDERVTERKTESGRLANRLLDDYLARMIDERLALKGKPDENQKDTKTEVEGSKGDREAKNSNVHISRTEVE